MIDQIQLALKEFSIIPHERAAIFFKTGAGGYAEGDQFIGVSVPNIRKIAKDFANITLVEIDELLPSKINEERLLALIILTEQYKKGSKEIKEKIYQFYLRNLQNVNNWNLVDSSAHLIIGAHLIDKDKSLLLTLAKSEIMWERRIAMVATWYFIRKGDLEWSFKLAALLLNDKHDLIHKAVGWMLREAGKKDERQLIAFLNENASKMPRTALRYSIEKLPLQMRESFLNIKRSL